MMRFLPAFAAAVAVGAGTTVFALPQHVPDGSPSQVAQNPESTARPAEDATDLGVSISRIRRGLRELPPSPVKDPLRLNYYIEVYGSMPVWRILNGVDLTGGGPVRYGGMTYNEFLRVTTPHEFHVPGGSMPMPKKKRR